MMNKVILCGRLTREPDIRYTTGENSMAVARFTLAVDRRTKRDGEQSADFINCVSFGKAAELAEKYYHQGTKLIITGRIQTGSYTNKDGQKVYTTDVVVEEAEFAESKSASGNSNTNATSGTAHSTNRNTNTNKPYPKKSSRGSEDFMNIPDDADEEMPWDV